MKIEKLNDFQIRCTLTAEDLKENHLAITDIAFCSDKAKSLFKDMIQHASEDFGFDMTSCTSLMVELKATSPENLVLTITRINEADDIHRYMSGLALGGSSNLASRLGSISGGFSTIGTGFAGLANPSVADSAGIQATPTSVRSFRFDSLDDVITAAKAIGGTFSGLNSLYKFGNGNNYQLLIHHEEEIADEIMKVCDIISEYALALTCTDATENYLKEHGGLIIENNAIQQLAYL